MTRILPWLLLSGVVAVAVVVVYRSETARQAEAEARQESEASLLEQADLARVRLATADELRAALEGLTKRNADLGAEVERLRKISPRVRVVRVTECSTGGVQAPVDNVASVEPAGAPCLLQHGDVGEIRVAQVELATDDGNRVLVGTAEAWRVYPDPLDYPILSGPFRADLTQALAEPEPDPGWPGWALGVAAAAGGLLVGGIAAAVR